MRKLLIAVAACGVLAMGATQPAQARVFIGFGFGPGYYYGHHHHFGPHCYLKNVRVKVWSKKVHHFVWVWRVKRFCW